MTPEPQVGDLVTITIKGVRVVEVSDDRAEAYFRLANESAARMFRLDLPAVTIEIVEPAYPAEWPPRLGDLWRDRDQGLWFGIDASYPDDTCAPIVELVGRNGGNSVHPADVNRKCGPLALVRRENTADPRPVVAEHPAWPPKAGDVWSDRGGAEWTAAAALAGGVAMRDGLGNEMAPEVLNRGGGPCTLVRRKYADQ